MGDTDNKTNNQNTEDNQVFRKKTLERISSPEQLSDCLKVTSPGVWVILVTVILLLTGIFIWATVGNLETTVKDNVTVQDNKAVIASELSRNYKEGMTVRVQLKDKEEEYSIESIETNDYGFSCAFFTADLPDGNYSAEVVTESIKPIDFLLK